MTRRDEPTCERVHEWVGVTDDHAQFLAEGNPNPGYEGLRLVTFDDLLSFGRALRVVNRRSMQFYCRQWNDIVRALAKSHHWDCRRMLVHPAKAEFSMTVPCKGTRRRRNDGETA